MKTTDRDTTSGRRMNILTGEQRHRAVCEAAYYIAEQHNFEGDPVQYWLEAEREIDSQF